MSIHTPQHQNAVHTRPKSAIALSAVALFRFAKEFTFAAVVFAAFSIVVGCLVLIEHKRDTDVAPLTLGRVLMGITWPIWILPVALVKYGHEVWTWMRRAFK